MSDKTPSSLFKHSLVLSTALAVMTVSASAEAYSRRNQLPSIEVHLEVLESLRQEAEMQMRQQQMVQQPTYGAQPQAMPFGRPSAPLAQPPAAGGAQYQSSGTSSVAPRPTPAMQPQQPVATPPAAPVAPATGYATYQPAQIMDEPVAAEVTPVPTPVVKPAEKPKPKPAPKPEPKAAPKPKPEPKVEQKPEPKPKPAPEPIPLPEPEVDVEAEATVDAMPPLDIPDMPAPRKLDALPEMDDMPLPEPKVEAETETDTATDMPSLDSLPAPDMEMPDMDAPLSEPDTTDLPPLPEADTGTEMESTPLVSMPEIEDTPVPELDEPVDMGEMPSLQDMESPTEENAAELEPLPALEGMADAEAQGEVSASEEAESSALVAPVAPAPPPPKKEEGMFSGLMGQIKSMLGMEEEKTPSGLVAEPADEEPPVMTLPEGALPMGDVPPAPVMEMEPQADAAAEMEMNASGLPPLPDMSDEPAPDVVAALPPLPTESVDEVPVSTTPNRALPPLDAIVSEERREEMAPLPMPEMPAEIAMESEADMPALDSLPAPSMDMPDMEPTPMKSLEELPEMPAMEADTELAAPEEMELASLPAMPMGEPIATAAEAESSASTSAAEVTNGGNSVRLVYGREEGELTPAMLPALDKLIARLKENPEMVVTMESYAGSDAEQDKLARTISLKRALGIRSYFIEADIAADRIKPPKVEGNDVPSGPLERVDVHLQ